MSAVVELLRPHLALIGLELARIGGVVAVSPIPWASAPRQVKVGLLLVLLPVVHGATIPPTDFLPTATWAALHAFEETLVGVAIGLVVRMTIAAAEIAGNTLAAPMGFGAAQAFDPVTGSSDSSLTRLFRSLALLLALSVGLHRVMLGALISSFTLLPVGRVSQLPASMPVLLELSSHALEMGVRLALPVLSVLLMANAALGFVARAAPTMQIFNVGFAVLLATGAVVMILALPEMGRQMVAESERSVGYLERLLMELSAP